jgi:hypothetical protein
MPISTFQLTSVVLSAAGSTLPVTPQVAASIASATQQAHAAAMDSPVQAAVVPVQPINILGTSTDVEGPCVLRIDNVPWVWFLMIAAFLRSDLLCPGCYT